MPTHLSANPGTLIEVTLRDLLPTQGALGDDEVHYKIARYRSRRDQRAGNINKRFDHWCETNGQERADSATDFARLDDATSFSCTIPLGQETPDSLGQMKTAVIGPEGRVYLTDGHHTFTAFREAPDGGAEMRIRVRVQGNLSHLPIDEFWKEMQARGWTWLFDEHDQPITVEQLAPQLTLEHFPNDPYRGMIFLTRDIGYVQVPLEATYQEFHWARWLRRQQDPDLQLGSYDLTSIDGYLDCVEAVSRAMVDLDGDSIVSDGRTAKQLGQMRKWNDGDGKEKGEFGRLGNAMEEKRPGKIAYLLEYRKG